MTQTILKNCAAVICDDGTGARVERDVDILIDGPRFQRLAPT